GRPASGDVSRIRAERRPPLVDRAALQDLAARALAGRAARRARLAEAATECSLPGRARDRPAAHVAWSERDGLRLDRRVGPRRAEREHFEVQHVVAEVL